MKLSGNTISGSCQTDLFVAFTRHATALGAAQLTRPYLKSSTYTISLGGDVAWSNAWYANVAGQGNTLVVDGATMAPGKSMAYNPNVSC